MKELIFEAKPHSPNGGYIDGPCRLPVDIQWPTGPDTAPLFHLFSLPLDWLDSDKAKASPESKWISVFISYDPKDYSHYSKMSSDEPEHSEAAVILHDMSGEERSLHPAQSLASKNVKLGPEIEDDENIASYVSSTPCWVQDPIDIEGYQWVLSVYGPDMDSALAENRGIAADGVGYVFLQSDLMKDSVGRVGKFFLQLG